MTELASKTIKEPLLFRRKKYKPQRVLFLHPELMGASNRRAGRVDQEL
jgi:hypothetical protein